MRPNECECGAFGEGVVKVVDTRYADGGWARRRRRCSVCKRRWTTLEFRVDEGPVATLIKSLISVTHDLESIFPSITRRTE